MTRNRCGRNGGGYTDFVIGAKSGRSDFKTNKMKDLLVELQHFIKNIIIILRVPCIEGLSEFRQIGHVHFSHNYVQRFQLVIITLCVCQNQSRYIYIHSKYLAYRLVFLRRPGVCFKHSCFLQFPRLFYVSTL